MNKTYKVTLYKKNTLNDFEYHAHIAEYNSEKLADIAALKNSDYLYQEALRYEQEVLEPMASLRLCNEQKESLQDELDHIYEIAWKCRSQQLKIELS